MIDNQTENRMEQFKMYNLSGDCKFFTSHFSNLQPSQISVDLF